VNSTDSAACEDELFGSTQEPLLTDSLVEGRIRYTTRFDSDWTKVLGWPGYWVNKGESAIAKSDGESIEVGRIKRSSVIA
jgi:hypothetical protein